MGYQNYLKPTYQGLVWETRRDITIESNFIDAHVAEWETTNVDFKREFGLDTQKQKGEFGKDVLGLVNTKSSGRRYMIIGFDDKTKQYHGPPDSAVTQNRMEQVLSNLTDPVVVIRYDVVSHKSGMVGKIEVIRQPEKLPYQATQDVFDDKGKRVLEKDKVYVRHGSQTEAPTPAELDALKEEGRAARGTP
jgi:predicted HTH transcriptional regulator